MKVLISDHIAEEGKEILKAAGLEVVEKVGLSPEVLKEAIADVDAILIRSGTKLTAEIIAAATRLKVIARAGTGLDNVDIDAANKRGIVVMNVPGGNTVSAAEHTISMMLALSRNIPQATASMKAGRWEKKKFLGREVAGKTLGIIGVGRIGSIVADRARGLKMKVLAYDPYITQETAEKLGVELVDLDSLLARSDYISVHVPLTKETKGFINRELFAKMKDGVMFINCARGGIVNEEDLYQALVSGKVAGAALDVFEVEPPPKDHPLFGLENFICTPHLGASTREAQKNVATAAASQIVDYLLHGVVRNAVNVPSVSADQLPRIQPFITLGEKIGALHTQLADGPIEAVSITYQGEMADMETGPITLAILKGILSPVMGDEVNYVNAPIIARDRGIKVTESKTATAEDFTNLLIVRVRYRGGENEISGTIFGKKEPRIVRINDFRLDAIPEGHMLFIYNEDRPGVIGKIGITLGEAGINISRMHVGQEPAQKSNIILLTTDKSVNGEVLERLKKLPHVLSARPLEL